MENLNVVRLARIALIIVALALSLGVGAKAVQAQTLFGLAHSGPDGLSTLYRINPATGGVDPVGSNTGFQRCSGMDFDASGILFATCERDDGSETHVLITIDPSTGDGEGVEVGPTGVGSGVSILKFFKSVSDISFRPSGDVLYAYLVKFNFLATIDVAKGEATAIMPPPPGIGNPGIGNGIVFSPEGELFHADEKFLNTLDLATGVATPVVDLVFPGLPSSPGLCCENSPRANALDFQPGTGILFASVNDRLLLGSGVERPHRNFLATIDTATGEVIIKGKTVKGLDAIAFAPAATSITSVEAELGSFKCYGVKRPKGSPKLGKTKVELNDRFDGTKDTRVEKAESVCVPVKYGSEISEATPSLTCYKIKDVKGQEKFQRLDVIVENELYGEGQALTLKKPKVICVPSTIVEP